jgi:hypothetical protein
MPVRPTVFISWRLIGTPLVAHLREHVDEDLVDLMRRANTRWQRTRHLALSPGRPQLQLRLRHDPQSTGMLSAIVAPLAAGGVPVWVASSFDGDLVLIPAERLDEAVGVLHDAGHYVAGEGSARDVDQARTRA